MANVKSIINMHNKKVIMGKKTPTANFNCVKKLYCPLSNQYQITNMIYIEKITSNRRYYHGKMYCGTNKGTFKQ